MKSFFFRAVAILSAVGIAAVGWQTLKGPRIQMVSDHRLEEREETDGPFEALKWRRLRMADENGQISADAIARARAQAKALVRPAARVAGDQWFQRGPDDLAGRARALVIDPNNTLVMWQGTAGGGVWKTTDGGTNWTATSDTLGSLAVSALALDTTNTNTLYAGTGEGYFNSDAIQGAGIYKTTDGGSTWSLLSGTASMFNVNKIVISPADHNLLLATCTDSKTWNNGGIWRSTNGGTSWTKVKGAYGMAAHSIHFVPGSPTTAVGTVVDYTSGLVTAVYSNDSGATWTNATGVANLSVDRVELRPAPNDTNTIYALTSSGSVYRSADKGVSYSFVASISGYGGQGWYDNDIWVSPTNKNLVCAAGVYVFRSTDGGSTWTKISNGYIQTDQAHPDVHLITNSPAFDGVNNKTVFVTTDGGVYKATDITTASVNGGWTRLDRTAVTSQFYAVAGDGPTGKIVGGLQDNGNQMLSAGSDHGTMIQGGDGGWVAVDPTDPTYSYNEYVYLQIARNTGGTGANGSTPIYNGLSDAFNYQANFIAPFIMDPNNPQTLLAGGASLWRCTNAKAATPTFASIKASVGSNISAIAVAKGNSDIVYVGHNDGRVYRSTNGTAGSPTWSAIDDNSGTNPFPNRYITRIMVDPDDSNKVYVCLGGYTTNNIWRSTNGGTSWSAWTGSGSGILPQAPVLSIVRHPSDVNTLYVGTEVGVFSSSDGGTTWSTTNDAPVNVSVDEVAFLNNSTTLVAATHGRGIWQLKKILLDSVTFQTNPVYGGNSTTGTVSLKSAAGTGGMTVALSSNSANASVPSSVFIPAGSTSANFTITTLPVLTDSTATITASNSGTSVSADLTIKPTTLAGLTLNPSEVSATATSTGTVTLVAPAPTGGLTVSLSSSNTSVATVPASVTIAEGATSGTFTATSKVVAAQSTSTITATLGTASSTAILTVDPVTVSNFAVNPTSFVGGTKPQATVTLGASAAGDLSILVTSNTTSAISSFRVPIAAGQTSGTFDFPTKVVSTNTTVTLTAAVGSSNKSATVTVKAPVLSTYSRNVSGVVGGSPNVLRGTITLTGLAPAGGLVATLTTSNPIVTAPATITVPAGKSSVIVNLTHSQVEANTSVTCSAKIGTITKSFNVTIMPYVKSLTLKPATVYGGVNSVATIALAAPAPSGGLVVTTTSSDPSTASVPASVTVPAGALTAKFTVTTTPVVSQKLVTIGAARGSNVKSGTLTVNPPVLTSLVSGKTSVVGGSTTAVSLTVNISGNAPAGGTLVSLSSSNSSAASVPASVLVPEGSKSVKVTVTHSHVSSNTVVTFTATLNGVNKTASLTVTP